MPPIFTIKKREEISVKLLEAGISIIKENGIRKISIERVTKRTGIGKGTFYHFFDSKEQYLVEVIRFSKDQMYQFLNQTIEERGGIDREAFLTLLDRFSVNGSNNIIAFMTKEDEAWLEDQFSNKKLFDREREKEIIAKLFANAKGLRKDRNPHVAANMMKIMGFTAEWKENLYEDALDESIRCLAMSLCDYLFEE
ncbi:TetR/AcrR family transcriptional regulator [Anaerosporobacter faecicola]|uniref:TetR/AcrR family transcriptional regulator n=1 Tax=Anaerosporobacter faecicola TaxID=2718714 RepID=UPI00143B8E5A|nr:TetR/AcrR family transcriptional regulator [Anaerosporobacter faecicola]